MLCPGLPDGPPKLQDMKMQDMKLTDQVAAHEIAGQEKRKCINRYYIAMQFFCCSYF